MQLFKAACFMAISTALSPLFCIGEVLSPSKPRVEFSEYQKGGYFILRFYEGSKKLWTAKSLEPLAVVLPTSKKVVFERIDGKSKHYRAMTCRDFNGQIRWQSHKAIANYGSYQNYLGGGNLILCMEEGPIFGATSREQVSSWPDYLREVPVVALDLRSGKILWRSHRGRVGWPVWSNGEEVVSIRWDFDSRLTNRSKKRTLPITVEVRNGYSLRLLYKKLIKGMPADLKNVSPVQPRKIKLYFEGRHREDYKFVRLVNPLSVIVPIANGSIASGLSSEVYRGVY